VLGRPASFDTILQALILLLVMATTLALGGVDPTALLAFEWLSLVLLLLWIVRAVWIPPAPGYGFPGAGEGAAPRGGLTLFGHRLVPTRLSTPIGVFIALVAIQLVPLPPGILRSVSPGAFRLYSESLPGYGTEGGVDFSRVGSFLLGPGHDRVVSRILGTPGDVPPGLSLDGSNLRTISIYPFVTLRQLMVFLSLLAVFIVTVNVFGSRKRIESILRAFVLFGFAYALFGIVQRLSWNGKMFWTIPVASEASPFGSFINHNHFAAFLSMIVPIAAGMLMDEGRRLFQAAEPGGIGSGPRSSGPGVYSTFGAEPFARLLLAAFVVAVMAGAIAFSASRGAVLALAGAVVFYGGALVVQGRVRRGEAIAGIVILGLTAGLALWLGLGPLAEKLYAISDVETEPSLFSRVLGWQWTVRIIGDFPLMGTGFGTFAQAWTRYYPPGTAAIWHEAHNDYLQLLSETGVIGIVVFAAALLVYLWCYILPGVLKEGVGDRYAVHGVSIGLIAVGLHSIVDFPLQINACALLFVVLAALLIAYRRREEAPS